MAVNAIPVLSPVHKGSRRSEIKCFNVAARENASAKSSIWHAFMARSRSLRGALLLAQTFGI
jgi:hypothetical protein